MLTHIDCSRCGEAFRLGDFPNHKCKKLKKATPKKPYIVLSSCSVELLESLVEGHIKLGYALYEGPFVGTDGGGSFHQAMTFNQMDWKYRVI